MAAADDIPNDDGDQGDELMELVAAAPGGPPDVGALDQAKIDSLFGFRPGDAGTNANAGIRALINSALVNYERQPMLEVTFDRLARILTTSLRNFTGDNVEVVLDKITSLRFGNYLNSVPLPAILPIVKVEPWNDYWMMMIDSKLIYATIDVLLGGQKGGRPTRVEGRPYTTIETTLVERMAETVLADAEKAFEPLAALKFSVDRFETNPRFVAIARPAHAAIVVRFRVSMETRGGEIEFLIPYTAIEPIRPKLRQGYMGEKLGRDTVWEQHLSKEIRSVEIDVDAIFFDMEMPLTDVMELKVGDTLMLEQSPETPITLTSGGVVLSQARVGRRDEAVAVEILHPLPRKRRRRPRI